MNGRRLALVSGGARVRPPLMDRMTLMTRPWHFQGLRAPIPELANPAGGYYGWFEPAIAWIPAARRPLVYQTKDAAGDTLYGISLSGSYKEDNETYNQFAGVDFTKNLPALNALIDEILGGGPGRAIRLFCAGDGQGSGPGYNSDVGLTYGAEWLIAYTPTLLASLDWRYRYCQLYPGYDDVWYGWNPDQLVRWPQAVRAIRPDAVMGFEHAFGVAPFVFTEDDWLPGGAMDGWDMISSEYNTVAGGAGPSLVHDGAVWEIKARLRYADHAYNRPADQPSDDDPRPPACLGDSSRGPRVHEDMEWATYYDVRGGCQPEGIEQDRAYLKPIVVGDLQG